MGGEVGEGDDEYVARTAEVGADGCRLHRDLVAAQHRRRLVGVRRAADVLEEGRVADVGRRGQAQVGRQPVSQHGRPRRLAGLEPHSDVGDE
jgi:hypothetical protein